MEYQQALNFNKVLINSYFLMLIIIYLNKKILLTLLLKIFIIYDQILFLLLYKNIFKYNLNLIYTKL